MTEPGGQATEILETGVRNLDWILGGGLPRRATVMIIGTPGIGKTILAQQIAFQSARRGDRVLYLTGFSETHDKMLAHGHGLSFFDAGLVGRELQFGSLPDLLREGPDETEEAIIATAIAQRAALVVLDGFRSMRGIMGEDVTAAHFLYSLGAQLALLNATTLVVVEGDPDDPTRYPEFTVCDTILALRRERRHGRERRYLQVIKARGEAPLPGEHVFSINTNGIDTVPRFESSVKPADPAWRPDRVGFGIPELDALFHGGLTVGTTTLVAGSIGVGKTLLGLHFLAAAARQGEPALLLGFLESPVQLREKARVFGIDLARGEAAGLIRRLVLPGHDLEADRIADRLHRDIEERGVRRLVLDSVLELERGIGSEEREPGFLSALVSYLRGQNVTTYLTRDIPTAIGRDLDFSETSLAVLAENLVLLRRLDERGRFRRELSILKMRFSDFDQLAHEYDITVNRGIRLAGPVAPGNGQTPGPHSRVRGASGGE